MIVTAQYAKRPLQVAQWARHNKYPDAQLQSALHEAANQATLFRTKEVARFASPLTALPAASAGDRVRWRGRWHSSPFAKRLWARVVLAQAPSEGPESPYTRVRVSTTAGVTVGDMECHYGYVALGTQIDTPAYFGMQGAVLNNGSSPVDLPTDTDLVFEVKDFFNARAVSMTLYESADVTLLAENYGATAPIYDTDRATLLERLRKLWKHAAHPLFRWSIDSDSAIRTRSSATAVNIVDNTSGSVSAATPGFWADGRQRSTVRRGTVPCVLYAYGSQPSNTGALHLRNSAGAILASISTIGALGWYTTTVNLPATLDKYDLQFASNGVATTSLYAAGVYQYEP